MDAYNADVEAIFKRQEDAMELLDRLRATEPVALAEGETDSAKGGRRDFRRWPTPEDIGLDLHDGNGWHSVRATDIGIGGARLTGWPDTIETPVPVRLRRGEVTVALVLADLMWQDSEATTAGIRFEFFDNDTRDNWAESLIDSLLARYSLS